MRIKFLYAFLSFIIIASPLLADPRRTEDAIEMQPNTVHLALQQGQEPATGPAQFQMVNPRVVDIASPEEPAGPVATISAHVTMELLSCLGAAIVGYGLVPATHETVSPLVSLLVGGSTLLFSEGCRTLLVEACISHFPTLCPKLIIRKEYIPSYFARLGVVTLSTIATAAPSLEMNVASSLTILGTTTMGLMAWGWKNIYDLSKRH